MGRTSGTVIYHAIALDVQITDYDLRCFKLWLRGIVPHASLKKCPCLSEEDAGLVMKYLREELQIIPENDGDSFEIENIEIESVNKFYEFLQGINYGSEFSYELECGGISDEMAFSIIYYLQEVLEMLPDNIERCHVCGCLYDSDCGGATITKESEWFNHETEKYEKFQESEYGLYCDDCRPD